jgi:hypothetical protein
VTNIPYGADLAGKQKIKLIMVYLSLRRTTIETEEKKLILRKVM